MVMLFIYNALEANASDTLRLNNGWQLRNAVNTINLPVVVPGNIHTDLR